MYLKSLEIQGFKSFPDKTVLNFVKGMTVIVGPNGSGKSNISDAVRWVLGEQSAKVLRGGRQEDVIFGGTQKRRPVGYCEVSLTLDNSNRTLDLDYNEVTVTRRYYRSGESEFFINRSAVRLRDIHELFMDTGLGRDGYSIIGQGRIDEILSQKSEDRRDIFEEAAGISKYRYRKEESEKKLLMADENLTRLNDIISEIYARIEPLKTESSKAAAFLGFRDELRVLEVSVWLDELDHLKDNLQKARDDYDTVFFQLKQSDDDLKALYKAAEDITLELHETDKKAEQIRQEIHSAENSQSLVENDIAIQKTNIENNVKNIERIKSEIQEHSTREGNITNQIHAQKERIAQLFEMQQAIEKDMSDTIAQAKETAGSSNDIKSRIDALAATKDYQNKLLYDDRSKILSLESTLSEIVKRREALLLTKEKQSNEMEAAKNREKEVSELIRLQRDEVDSQKNMVKGFELKVNARADKAAKLKDALEKEKTQTTVMQNRLDMFLSMERDYEGFSRAVKMIMQNSAHGSLKHIHGPVSKLISTKNEYITAVETAFGTAMQNIVCDNEDDAKAAIGFLKGADAGRATFLPMSSVKAMEFSERAALKENGLIGIAAELVSCDNQYRDIVKNLVGRCAVCDHLDNAVKIARKYGYRFKIVTLDGQVINAGGSITGGSAAKSTGILSRSREIEELKGKVESQKAVIQKLESDLSEVSRELSKMNYDLEASRSSLREWENNLLKTETQKKQHMILLENIQMNLTLQETEEEEIASRRGQIAAEIQTLSDQAQQQVQRIGEISADIADMSQNYSALSEKQGVFSGKISDYKEELAKIVSERDTLSKSLEEMETLGEALEGDKTKRLERILEYEAKNQALSAVVLEKEKIREEYAGIILVKRKILQDQNTKRLEIEASRTKKEKESYNKNQELLHLEREKIRLEGKKTQLELQEGQLLERLWEGYELTRASAQSVRCEIPAAAKANRRINELRGKIKELGTVNINAIEEYKEVCGRYEFLSAQKDDIEKAKEELTKVISALTRSMRDIFVSEFERINQYFGETFREIFGGGSAQIELSDQSDILNCGIEIKVSPPGKTLKNITLLSGGEKAFAAIALYFAMLKVRSSPFCVLDEIETALDDANVLCFAKYLKKLCTNTQFIAISHRRYTMEEADMLYGVTMQEQGVSKLLALNISEIEEQLSYKPQ